MMGGEGGGRRGGGGEEGSERGKMGRGDGGRTSCFEKISYNFVYLVEII